MIAVGWSDHGMVQGEFCYSLMYAVKSDAHNRSLIDNLFAFPSAAVSRGRNTVFEHFQTTDSEWLLMVDADTVWGVSDIYNLYDIAVANNLKLLNGIYFFNHPDKGVIPVLFNPGDEIGNASLVNLKEMLDKDIIEIQWAGLGAMIIHRDLVEQTKTVGSDGRPYWFAEGIVDGFFAGEDYFFFNKVREAGHKIYATPRVLIDHIKKTRITINEYLENNKA
jgi:hypothetical protein